MTTNTSPNIIPLARSSATLYVFKRGTIPLSFVYSVYATGFLLQDYSNWTAIVQEIGPGILVLLTLCIGLVTITSAMICIIWGVGIDLISMLTVARTQHVIALLVILTLSSLLFYYAIWTETHSVVIATSMLAPIHTILGFWTWRYWTTLEPIEKKKKRGEV